MKGKRSDAILGDVLGEHDAPGPLAITDGKAKRLVDLVKKGVDQKEAEKVVGAEFAELRQAGGLTAATQGLLARAEETGLLKTPEAIQRLAKARLLELAMQDDDLRVATAAAKALVGDSPKVGVQVNVVRDEKVTASLMSLGIIEEEKEDQ